MAANGLKPAIASSKRFLHSSVRRKGSKPTTKQTKRQAEWQSWNRAYSFPRATIIRNCQPAVLNHSHFCLTILGIRSPRSRCRHTGSSWGLQGRTCPRPLSQLLGCAGSLWHCLAIDTLPRFVPSSLHGVSSCIFTLSSPCVYMSLCQNSPFS